MDKSKIIDKKLIKMVEYTASRLAYDHTGHSYDHACRVADLTRKILTTESEADEMIALTAAYLHDTIDDKVVEDEAAASEELISFLQTTGFDSEDIREILAIIQNISYSKSLDNTGDKLSLEGQIVQDADRLDALGAIGILRTAYYGGSQGYPIFNPDIQPIDYQNKKEYRKGSTVINHFYEKLLLLADQMNTAYAKAEGQRRTAFMRGFLEEFFDEWQLKDNKN